jgi:hypothetical protein
MEIEFVAGMTSKDSRLLLSFGSVHRSVCSGPCHKLRICFGAVGREGGGTEGGARVTLASRDSRFCLCLLRGARFPWKRTNP